MRRWQSGAFAATLPFLQRWRDDTLPKHGAARLRLVVRLRGLLWRARYYLERRAPKQMEIISRRLPGAWLSMMCHSAYTPESPRLPPPLRDPWLSVLRCYGPPGFMHSVKSGVGLVFEYWPRDLDNGGEQRPPLLSHKDRDT